jgi:hypothetical protein
MYCFHLLKGKIATCCADNNELPYPILLEKEVIVYPDNRVKARELTLFFSNLEILCKLAKMLSKQ